MNQQPNGILEDVCAEIGFTATMMLCAIHGGKSLYVPAAVTSEHPLAKLLGKSAFKALTLGFGGETMAVPRGEEFERWRRVRQVSELLSKGFTTRDVARALMLTPHQVRNLKSDAEDLGLMPMVMTQEPRSVGSQIDLVSVVAGGDADKPGVVPGALLLEARIAEKIDGAPEKTDATRGG